MDDVLILVEKKQTQKCYKNKKCMILSSFLCSSIFLYGLIFINIKCGSFNNNLSPCDYPNYCPNKYLCDGSDLI
jgi:hypothetical protein